MKSVVAAAAFSVVAVGHACAAPSFILCQAPEKSDIILELDSMTFEDKILSCLSGGGFVADMTPCAPDGGYGLSAPTGSAALVRTVDRWQDYGDHLGGVVSFSSSPTNYWFEGGFMGPESYDSMWTFDVSRLTGKGELSIVQEVEEGGEVGTSLDIYDCAPVTRKF